MGQPTAYAIFRTTLAIGTWTSLALGLATRDLRWMAASGAFGTLWWTADFLVSWVFAPLAEFMERLFEGDVDLPPVETRPTADDTIRLLEHHIEGNASRHVQIQSALRLADLYRVVDRDEVRSRAVLDRVRARFPDAEELNPL